jgi:hypothetical protein
MNQRILSLLLAGTLSLTLLAGCAPKGSESSQPPETTPMVTPTQPAEHTETSVLPTEPPETEPTETPGVAPESTPGAAKPSQTPKPSEKPNAAPPQKPQASPEATPVPTPSESPDSSSVVTQVWEQIAADLADVLPSSMDLTGDDLKSTYGIDPADLEDYVCKLPMMSAHITEFFIAKVKDGKMDAVKAALQARQEALAGGFLYPSLVELVEDYKLVVNGNYILFCITENADQAVEIFDDYTK